MLLLISDLRQICNRHVHYTDAATKAVTFITEYWHTIAYILKITDKLLQLKKVNHSKQMQAHVQH